MSLDERIARMLPPHLRERRLPRHEPTLAFLRAFFAEHGKSPTYGQIAVATDCGVSTAQDRVFRLSELGLVTTEPGWRGITLTERT